MTAFSIKECLSYGWNTFKLRPWFFIGATAIVFIISFIISSLFGAAKSSGMHSAESLGFLVQLAVGVLLGAGQIKFFLRAHQDPNAVVLKDLWAPELFWSFLGMSIISLLGIGVGLVLLVVPGVLLGIMWMFGSMCIGDMRLGPVESLKESARLTKGHRWNLLGFVLIMVLLNILGFVVFFVGMLVTSPITLLALVRAYHMLKGSALTAEATSPAAAIPDTEELFGVPA